MKEVSRRQLLAGAGKFLILSNAAAAALNSAEPNPYDAAQHWWGMTIDIDQCIGCGNCATACQAENKVPEEFHRTWIERYQVKGSDYQHPKVESPHGGREGFTPLPESDSKSFYVPKLCNHCATSPCVQVCPVGATFESPDGVVLVDDSYCVGCRYCVQACPYGTRFIHPEKQVADKCTLCYHRITQGLTTACAEVCPTGARQLADLKDPKDPVHEFLRANKIQVLKPQMATGAKVFYKDLDVAVR